MSLEDTEKVKSFIKEYDDYIDWLTIGTKLTYSGSFINTSEKFNKAILYYNNLSPINDDISEYIKDISIVHYDWKELYFKYNNVKNVIFLVDPPYLNSNTTTYDGEQIDHKFLYDNIFLNNNKFILFSLSDNKLLDEYINDQYNIISIKRKTLNSTSSKSIKYELIIY